MRSETVSSRFIKRGGRGEATYLLVAKVFQLGVEVVDSMEDGRILLQEVAEGLSEGLWLALGNLTETTDLVCGQMPVDLVDFARGKLADARGAHPVLTSAATLHVGEDKVLRS